MICRPLGNEIKLVPLPDSQESRLILNTIKSYLGVFLLDLINSIRSPEVISHSSTAPAKEMDWVSDTLGFLAGSDRCPRMTFVVWFLSLRDRWHQSIS